MQKAGTDKRLKRFPARGDNSENQGDFTEDGRYIPYSGGCMGWFNNSGVLKSELMNNYTFHTVVDSELIRMKQFERTSEHWAQRRSSFRTIKSLPVNLMIRDPDEDPTDEKSIKIDHEKGSLTGKSNDISLFGMSIQFLEEPHLAKGDEVVVFVMESDETALMEVKSEIVWINMLQHTRPVWNVGIAFSDITKEINVHLNDLMK